MTNTRYSQLMNIADPQQELELTQAEIDQGWHYCWEFDGLLVGPEMKGEWDCCRCFENKTKYEN